MRIVRQRKNDIYILGIRGTLDASGAGALRNTVDELVDRGDLVIDFSWMRHADRAGLDGLHRCLKSVRQAGGDMKLAAISRKLSGVFAMSGLLRISDVYDEVADAVDAVEPSEPSEPEPVPAFAMSRWRVAAALLQSHLADADTVPLT